MSDYSRKQRQHEECANLRRHLEEGCVRFDEVLLTTDKEICPCCGWRPNEEYIRNIVADQETLL